MIDSPAPFIPAFGLGSGHAQTLYPALCRREVAPQIDRERFELDDGDFVDCFWHKRDDIESSRGIVVLFHGLEGSFDSPYIQGMMRRLGEDGYSSVLMHFRGCSGEDNRLHYSYHSGKTDDAKAWIEELMGRYPNSPIHTIGYSLGGNMMLKLLGEYSDTSPIKSAISISAPLRLDICADRIDRGFSKIYQKHLMRSLTKSLVSKYERHDMESYIGIDADSVKTIETFWEFDDIYTARVNGFSSAQEYYSASSAIGYLKDIKIPTLIIQALDDPFMTPEILPKKEEISSSIELEVYPHGGHVGFVSGTIYRPIYWLEGRISRFLLLHNKTL
ncbi:Hydrolase, alpha/beta fold family functionally coupled to Phosphoribulokinase [hydrothermal vent metagenome]|uniref:Hydrolase, alpha/beta fold family functionally coupled to Phosphoribulokinase n=1 Tax=hydrothermal vent metagenome TaxID=652676 RepID=A0A1W1CE19_9ZZZZ